MDGGDLQMDLAVLGPLKISLNGTSIVPAAGKLRQLLALLGLRAGQVVPVSTLMEEVWGARIPRSAHTTLQTYILQLRRRIAAALPPQSPLAAKRILLTEYGSYTLAGPMVNSDLTTFRRLAVEGGRALDAGENARAAEVLARALDLWRGPALADVPTGSVLETEALGIDEIRIHVLEQRIEADLRLGRHTAILGELQMLVAQYPFHETFSGQLMRALTSAGHTWRALEVYRRFRDTLVAELGVDPSARLQHLHQVILGGSPDGPARTVISGQAPAVRSSEI
ncbi:AfsR/SARP family transcriptional regulator [Dactylosporangium roseum]|uniref:AfsR/SARP family transcriptional regulator n=1 Tax=Dactylosporangium roseum TaxID=47989 RepID=A0ABY5ZEJ1_9ACTN|nr:AfsR/SARP family transcriptional regulator [Dactylosporangium roseum]UWZ39360.1 AfsR/SARP family transcriptional regulator [Dactylosporangium roseum]